MNKPTNPNLSLPTEFATNGVKTDFSASKISDGFDRLQPDVLPGDCLNKFIDDTYKGLNYAIAGTDAVNLIQENEVLTVESGELVSKSPLPAQSTATAMQYLMSNGTSAEWTDFTGANQDLSNLSNAGNEKMHALKGYLDNGELLTDAEGLADVNYYAHSTFDADKFALVGSPTITDDGVISDFSTSNYLTVSLNNSYNTLEIKSKIKVLNDLSNSCYYNFSNSDNSKYFDLAIISGKLRFRVVSNATLAYSFDVNTNTEYYTRFTFDGTTYKCAISTDGATWNEQTVGVANAINIIENCYIGNVFNQTLPCLGAIDIKYFDVKFNNVPIFSGNLTDVDNIKSDFSGSATVSATGIASGFSASDYLTFDTSNVDWTKPFDLYVSCKTGNVATVINSCLTSYGMPLLGDHSDGVNHYWRLHPNGIPDSFILGGVTQALPATAVASNTDYWHHVNYDGTKFTWKISTNGTNYTTIGTLAGTATISATTAWLGNQQGTTSRYWTGSVNLNSVKVYQYDNIVCQPCLRIPYTASKTGSKVVDSYYRERVTDMYNQFGYAPYYTLSDNNFTLPMGEVYGLIGEVEKKVTEKIDTHDKAHIVDTFTSGSTWGRIYSDGFKMQGGVIYGSATTESIPSPTLTENGVAGGNSIAVISDSERNATYKTYYAIDGSTTSQWIPDTNTWANHWWGIYFPNPVTFAKIEWLRRSGETNNFLITGKIEYSSDGSNWTELENISPTGQSGGNNNYQTVTISNTGTYAKYWRIYCLTGNGGCGFREISFYRDSSTKGLTQQVQGVNAIVFPEPFSSSSYSYSLEGLGGTATALTVSATGINLGTITATQVSWMASGY